VSHDGRRGNVEGLKELDQSNLKSRAERLAVLGLAYFILALKFVYIGILE
jgi:hypothetical protein